ncbi:MAG TPA: hypothetical protein VMA55_06715 [Acidovorax sp.]|nr:hypothetical protein [Acidovorax sp.]
MSTTFNSDQLIAMAKEAGLTDPDLGDWMTDYGDAQEGITKFAELVAAREREACAQYMEDCGRPGSAAAIRALGRK